MAIYTQGWLTTCNNHGMVSKRAQLLMFH